jgi:uncharacterized protein YajQ (UPF0234 family)
MAQQTSFDIVSEVNLQEVDNAVQQALKEATQRYDLKDSHSSIVFDKKEKTLVVESGSEFHLKSVVDILHNKLIKRGVPLKALKSDNPEPAAGGAVRQTIRLRVGIDTEHAKQIVKTIKATKLKVQAQIMNDQVRVSGKNKDDLQAVIAALRAADLPVALQFINYR